MAERDRAEERKRRAERREQRRGAAPEAPVEQETGLGGEPLIKEALKVVGGAAAVGAAVGAARALTNGSDDRQDDDDADAQAERAAAPAETPKAGPAQDEPAKDEQADDDADAQAERAAAPAETPKAGAAQDEPAEDEPAKDEQADGERAEQDAPTGTPSGDLGRLLDAAKRELEAIQGRPAESVSGFDRGEDGWVVQLEVVEVPRVPASTDVMASYQLTLDGDGNVVRYRRARRYYRSQAGLEETT